MNKIDGLKFLQKYFPEICVDCVFVGPNEDLNIDLLKSHVGIFRVRAGCKYGSELNLPRRTCYSISEVKQFIEQTRLQYNRIEFVIHRVTEDYFALIYETSIALFESPLPEMIIQIQGASQSLVAQMDVGVKARDWPVLAIYRFPYLGMLPDVTIFDHMFQRESFKTELYFLWNAGRKIDAIKQGLGMCYETVTLFNVYPGGKFIVDDHRSLDSFAPPTA